MNVRILPKSQRAKNRVREHGEVMSLHSEDLRNGRKHILVESVNDTWNLNDKVKTHWMGWFDESEADWEMV
jgi:hypothetical protein